MIAAPRTPPALIIRVKLEEAHIAFLRRKRAPAWAQLCIEIREWKERRQARYNEAIRAWQLLCFSDSDIE